MTFLLSLSMVLALGLVSFRAAWWLSGVLLDREDRRAHERRLAKRDHGPGGL